MRSISDSATTSSMVARTAAGVFCEMGMEML